MLGEAAFCARGQLGVLGAQGRHQVHIDRRVAQVQYVRIDVKRSLMLRLRVSLQRVERFVDSGSHLCRDGRHHLLVRRHALKKARGAHSHVARKSFHAVQNCFSRHLAPPEVLRQEDPLTTADIIIRTQVLWNLVTPVPPHLFSNFGAGFSTEGLFLNQNLIVLLNLFKDSVPPLETSVWICRRATLHRFMLSSRFLVYNKL